MSEENEETAPATRLVEDDGMTLGEMLGVLRDNARLLVAGPLAAGLLAIGVTTLMAPIYTATITFMPPQQAQSSAASALASLGSLAGLAGAMGGAGGGNSADRYVALMQSVTVSDRIVDHFKLMDAYQATFRVDARQGLANNVRIALGRKDGLITVEVDDKVPQRAADMANRYVEELRRITANLAVTEAQQRRVFFEGHLQQSRDRLAQAQKALEASGFNPGALKAEPKAAAEAYARLKAEATAAAMRLGLLRSTLADGTPEIQQQQALLAALRNQLERVEKASDTAGGPDYVGKYREFKYQETLFDVYARQFELARTDESREGALIQVVDAATPPERKSKPKRLNATLIATFATLFALTVGLLARQAYRRAGNSTDQPPTN